MSRSPVIYVVQLQITSTCKYILYAVRFFKDPITSKLGRVVITPAQEQTQSKTTKHRIHHPLTLCDLQMIAWPIPR